MLIVDDREREIVDELKRYDGIKITVCRLEFGDCQFSSRPDFFSRDDGNPYGLRGSMEVGCERKHVGDLLTSMRDRRLSGHQLKGMAHCFNLSFLFIEDQWRPTASGSVEVWRYGKWRGLRGAETPGAYRQIDAYLTTLALRGEVQVRRTLDVRETAEQWVNLWRWFNEKTWKQHRSHDQVFIREPGSNKKGGKARFSSFETSLCYEWATRLVGIDDVKARRVAKHFGSGLKMALANEEAWMEIDGVGRHLAELAVRAIRGLEGKK